MTTFKEVLVGSEDGDSDVLTKEEVQQLYELCQMSVEVDNDESEISHQIIQKLRGIGCIED